MYYVCANCRIRGKARSYGYPKGWRSRAFNKEIALLCPECQAKLKNGRISPA
ncbi:hypothetical protein GF412_05050 [Candidatus Micrarchaeota archaeon]|nr:hypothetical protein [Candidatus Micrarchaeota archaeon]MBD3418321.1 hypothetical protein [Candidatus Micrarchaeota archaeon]